MECIECMSNFKEEPMENYSTNEYQILELYSIPVSDDDYKRDCVKKYAFPTGEYVELFDNTTGMYDSYEPEYEVKVFRDGHECAHLHRIFSSHAGANEYLLRKFTKNDPTTNRLVKVNQKLIEIRTFDSYPLKESNGLNYTYELPNGILVYLSLLAKGNQVVYHLEIPALTWQEMDMTDREDMETFLHGLSKIQIC